MALAAVATAALALSTAAVDHSSARVEERALKLFNVHTNERATIVFKRGGRFDQAGLKEINRFLRDWRRNEPTNMDPQLLDVLWQAYRESGSSDYIHVICGYRAPETNGALRRRSSGVAKNSLHMQGKAIDFYIPGVELSKLRAIGLRMQAGGVGFYPSSGSPFVHLDTGSVRHWPRMSRKQLVAVFPNGGTIHVPSDGKPLPGYNEALAAYKARKASGGTIAVASAAPEKPAAPAVPAADASPIVLASADRDEEAAPSAPRRAVAVASYETTPPPMPRLAPRRTDALATIIAAAAQLAPVVAEADAPPPVLASAEPTTEPPVLLAAAVMPRIGTPAPGFDFGPPQDWIAPAVPAALAKAMAERDEARRGASLPIPPTAVVSTIDMSRPLRAAAITTAVLRRSDEPVATVPRVMAYAPEDDPAIQRPQPRVVTASGIPMPILSPRHRTAAAAVVPSTRSVAPATKMRAPELTMTALDTQGLRLWIGPASTRQKLYALLTMPDFAHAPELMEKPALSFGAGFGEVAYVGLRTDRFSGPLVDQPQMVDLAVEPLIAAIR